jgi:hypothetical protein
VLLFVFLSLFSMYIGCWNVRGLNDPLKHSKLHHLVQKERMALLGLIQTQVRERKKKCF